VTARCRLRGGIGALLKRHRLGLIPCHSATECPSLFSRTVEEAFFIWCLNRCSSDRHRAHHGGAPQRRDEVTEADLVELRLDSVRDPNAAGRLAAPYSASDTARHVPPAWEGWSLGVRRRGGAETADVSCSAPGRRRRARRRRSDRAQNRAGVSTDRPRSPRRAVGGAPPWVGAVTVSTSSGLDTNKKASSTVRLKRLGHISRAVAGQAKAMPLQKCPIPHANDTAAVTMDCRGTRVSFMGTLTNHRNRTLPDATNTVNPIAHFSLTSKHFSE